MNGLPTSDPLPEVQPAAAPSGQGTASPDDALRDYKLKNLWNGAAVWFFMIGGFTVLNFVLALSGADFRMILSLITVWLPIGLLRGTGLLMLIVEGVIVAIAAAVFGVLGFYVRKRQTWALVAGWVIFAIDFAVFLFVAGFQNYIDILLRVFALASLIGSYRVIRNGGEPPAQAAPTKIGSRVGGYLSLGVGGLAVIGVAWLAFLDVAQAARYGDPSTGSWSLTFTIYGIGLAVAGLLIWIGVRMLRDVPRADRPT